MQIYSSGILTPTVITQKKDNGGLYVSQVYHKRKKKLKTWFSEEES